MCSLANVIILQQFFENTARPTKPVIILPRLWQINYQHWVAGRLTIRHRSGFERDSPSVRLILSKRIELPITTSIKMKIKLPPYFQAIKSSSFYRLRSPSDQKHLPLFCLSFFSSSFSRLPLISQWNRWKGLLDTAGALRGNELCGEYLF